MCTAINLTTRNHYFGRNLDLNRSYGEQVVIAPRHLPFSYRKKPAQTSHYAMIGMAALIDAVPLFYDAANEKGLAMAGLNFPKNAAYGAENDQLDNITPFEFIPWILGQCTSVDEAVPYLKRLSLINLPFSAQLPLSPLHWILSDCKRSVVIEAMQDGLHLYDAPTGVLTNNPPYPYQLFHLNNYRNIGIDTGENRFAPGLSLEPYCQGLGGIGIPGDNSSMSRFVRAVWGTQNSVCDLDEHSSVSQFFHLLSLVEMVRGTCKTDEGDFDLTIYSSCINTDQGKYYYSTYDNRQISCVDLFAEDLEADALLSFPLRHEMNLFSVNR